MTLEVKNQQVWTLENTKKKKDKHQDAGLVEKYKMKMKLASPLKEFVPYEQNLVTETMFYSYPKQQCLNKMPHWTNLKSPDRIRADSSFANITIAAFKDNGLPICNSVD